MCVRTRVCPFFFAARLVKHVVGSHSFATTSTTTNIDLTSTKHGTYCKALHIAVWFYRSPCCALVQIVFFFSVIPSLARCGLFVFDGFTYEGLRVAVRLPGGISWCHDQHFQHPRRYGALHLSQAGPGRPEAQEGKVKSNAFSWPRLSWNLIVSSHGIAFVCFLFVTLCSEILTVHAFLF